MKKISSLFLALVMVLTLCVPAVAAERIEEDVDLPPWVAEGEIWHPASGIMTREDFGNCPRGHEGPAGYKYQGYTEGNALLEGFITGTLVSLVGFVPGLGALSFAVNTTAIAANMLYAIQHDGRMQARYFKHVYLSPSGMLTFNHVIWVYENSVNPNAYLDCETYYA